MRRHCAKEVAKNEIDVVLSDLKNSGAELCSVSYSSDKFLIIYKIEEDEHEIE